jgi:DNA-binding CsgD family transcriptional regulator
VEVLLGLGDVDGARRASDELQEIAKEWPGRVLEAVSAQARGGVELAAGDPEGALPLLRRACRAWDALDAPYDAAQARVLIGRACRALGDGEGADMEAAAARSTFERLGAVRELSAPGASLEPSDVHDHGLTRRELEVLQWLASGRTNRAIGDALSISEKTVARHVANIYGKLGVSSRAAATAFAYEHDLARS